LRYRSETLKYVSLERKVSRKVFQFAVDLMAKHLKFPAARNSLYSTRDIHGCLLQLSLREGYAEGGLANLSLRCNLPDKVPTGRTFRGRVERVEVREIRRTLTEANDDVLRTLKGYGVFRRRAVVAIDYHREPFYGDPNAEMVVGGPYDRGTPWNYCYASIHVVEAGRRLTLYTMPIHQFTEKATAVERLLEEAKTRGVHIGLVLLDRAFFTVDVISALKRLGVRFIMPAVKNRKVKDVIEEHYWFKTGSVQRFTLGVGEGAVRFNLAIYPRPEEALTGKRRSIHERYLSFATNLPKAKVTQFPALIPQEYRRRWGIETGYRVQGSVEAKTTSRNYALRILYHMSSVLIYNIWQYANILLARAAKKPFTRPLIKLGSLAAHFEAFILGGLGPPRR
jgi:hypothetical protein